MRALDFDETLFKIVRYWAFCTRKDSNSEVSLFLNQPRIIISQFSYWESNLHIAACFAPESENSKLEVSTYAVQKRIINIQASPKNKKPSPRIVIRVCKKDNEIRNFSKYRSLSRKIESRKLYK